MDRGLTLRTYLWLAGCLFILAGSASFLAYLKWQLPWWTMVVALGVLVGAIVLLLEQVLAAPLDDLAQLSARPKEALAAPVVGGWLPAREVRRVWRGVRTSLEHVAQARQVQRSAETQLAFARGQLKLLTGASQALRAEVALEDVAPGLLRDLAKMLGLETLYLVPLRRHCPVPVIGLEGQPDWGDELRATGFAPWEDLFAQDVPASVCLSPIAPAWRDAFGSASLWVVPLGYHGRPQGLLLASGRGTERALTPDEWLLLASLSQLLAASLHPPRWSEERQRPEPEPEPDSDHPNPRGRRGRRRHRQGA